MIRARGNNEPAFFEVHVSLIDKKFSGSVAFSANLFYQAEIV